MIANLHHDIAGYEEAFNFLMIKVQSLNFTLLCALDAFINVINARLKTIYQIQCVLLFVYLYSVLFLFHTQPGFFKHLDWNSRKTLPHLNCKVMLNAS